MINIEDWLSIYQQTVCKEFGGRVLFIGIQGSYARGEATDKSDIDVVLILDRLDFSDLEKYREITAGLPYRELLCGFIAGRKELEHWEKSDLFQFFFDTRDIYGQLQQFIPIPSFKDAKKAVLIGACNLYHACSHNYLHTANPEVLAALYKSARFVLQAKYFCESGRYLSESKELKKCLQGTDKLILETAMQAGQMNKQTLKENSSQLFEWSKELIARYSPENPSR